MTDLRSALEEHGYVAIQTRQTGVGHVEVRVKVDGHPATMLVDSGASSTVLDRRFIDSAGLNVQEADVQAAGADGSDLETVSVRVASLEVGSFPAGAILAYSFDMSPLNAQLAARGADPAHGILGADFLRSHKAILDYGSYILFVKVPK